MVKMSLQILKCADHWDSVEGLCELETLDIRDPVEAKTKGKRLSGIILKKLRVEKEL